MKTILHLNNANYTINLKNKQDEQDIIKQVQEDFRQFTLGTHKDYRNADKLFYLDMIRGRLHFNFDEYVHDFIEDKIRYEQDTGVLDNKFEIEFDYEFAEQAYKKGGKNFYESGENSTLFDNIATIIKAVMDYQ